MRERLGAHLGEIHTFTGVFQEYARTSTDSNVACFRRIELNGAFMADHVWVHRSKHMKRLELQAGDVVEFEARVGKYARGEPMQHVSEIQIDYKLEKLSDMRIIRRREERESA